jgi:AcrR family transcriptional regulator
MPETRRRRADEVAAAIRQAVRAELAERGYAGVTYEGVARRARTSKPVLYRRYPSRAAMVVDSLTTFLAGELPEPTSGSLRDDLVDLIATMYRRAGPDGVKTFLGIVAEIDADAVAEVTNRTFALVERRLREIVDAARSRGELGPRAVGPRVLSATVSLARGELLFAQSTQRPTDLDGLVDEVIVPLLRVSSDAGS